MAEPTNAPSLPSTADPTPYVPVSWAAAAAATVAATFLGTLLVLGYFAYVNKKPLLVEELLAMPVVALVLCFAARRMIRNSEGTRTETLYGVNLVNTAWWTSLVVGLCFAAYLFAIGYAIRRDARVEAEKWMAQVVKGTDESTETAFKVTIPPGQRSAVANDRYQLQTRYRDELLSFGTCDLLKLAQRNKGELEFVPGPVTWAYKPGTVECVVTGTVKCAEGVFPVLVPLKGTDGVSGEGGGRQWTITRPGGGGFVDQARVARTPYGRMLQQLEQEGSNVGREFVRHLSFGPSSHVYAYRAFVMPGGDRATWAPMAFDPIAQLAGAAPIRAAAGDFGYAEYIDKHFFKFRNGAEPPSDKKEQFLRSWNAMGIKPAGDKLKDPGGQAIDKEDQITVTESAVEVRVPIEVPLPHTGRLEVARGRLVVVCTDPAVLAELKRLKASANPAEATAGLAGPSDRARDLWRVQRVESDLAPVNLTAPGPGMGMMGMGGPTP